MYEFGGLVKVRLEDVNVGNANVMDMIKYNPQLKSLAIVKCIGISGAIFTAIHQLKNLEELEYKTRCKGRVKYLNVPSTLKKIEILKFDGLIGLDESHIVNIVKQWI